jgi:hypothetical protein
MKIRVFIAQAVLYLFIVSSGLQIGAAAYETFVITPLWSRSPPESVTNWNPVAQYAINPGLYWIKGTLLYVICALLLVIVAWFMPKARRNLTLFAGVAAIAIVIVTETYFVPILVKTIFTRGAGYSGAEITQMVNSWVNWNWLRFAAGLAAWLAAIRALSLPNDAPREFYNGGDVL